MSQKMAAFSYQHQPFLLNSNFLANNIYPIINNSSSNNNNNMSGFIEEGNIINTNFLPQLYSHHETVHSLDVRLHAGDHRHGSGSSSSHVHDQTSKAAAAASDNETSAATRKQSTDSSTEVDNNRHESGEQVTQKVNFMGKKRKNSAQSKDARKGKSKKQKKCNNNGKKQQEEKPNTEKKAPEEPPTGYIHVRARRGQATDSHSLAERARREKISERMKILQSLVPGCDKVIGKALILDEIINYVQSLQNQVELLSLKLAFVNPLFYDFGMDLDTFMVSPESLSSMASPLSSLQQGTLNQTTALVDANTSTTTTTFGTVNNCPLIENSASLLLQGQRPDDFTQDSSSLLWDLEGQGQKFFKQSGISNLCSFH